MVTYISLYPRNRVRQGHSSGIVTIEDTKELICALSNGTISNVKWPHLCQTTPFSTCLRNWWR